VHDPARVEDLFELIQDERLLLPPAHIPGFQNLMNHAADMEAWGGWFCDLLDVPEKEL
jgi:hypothetical protein